MLALLQVKSVSLEKDVRVLKTESRASYLLYPHQWKAENDVRSPDAGRDEQPDMGARN